MDNRGRVSARAGEEAPELAELALLAAGRGRRRLARYNEIEEMPMALRDSLHRLVDDLPESEITRAERLLAVLVELLDVRG